MRIFHLLLRQSDLRVREVNSRASVLINWFPVQTCYVQLIFVIAMQCWKRKTS